MNDYLRIYQYSLFNGNSQFCIKTKLKAVAVKYKPCGESFNYAQQALKYMRQPGSRI
jgi:hypothetical protein